jgi:hypothetical protein
MDAKKYFQGICLPVKLTTGHLQNVKNVQETTTQNNNNNIK